MYKDQLIPLPIRILLAPFLLWSRLLQTVTGCFNRLDERIIDFAVKNLPDDSSEILALQLSEINLTKRVTAKTTEVLFFKVGLLGADFSRKRYFNFSESEVRILSIRIVCNDRSDVKADLWVVNGRFFSIEFDSDVRDFDNELSCIVKMEINEK